MANETYKGIEVGGIIYDNEDETARNGVNTNTTSIGTLTDLETEEKTNLVGSINELLRSMKSVYAGFYHGRFFARRCTFI